MATRYSGDVTVRVDYVDTKSAYRCRVKCADGAKTIIVHPARASQLAVDSAAAYDETARAAISFADHDGLAVQPEYASVDGNVVVHRFADPQKAKERAARAKVRRTSSVIASRQMARRR
jgi:hypothetical protein